MGKQYKLLWSVLFCLVLLVGSVNAAYILSDPMETAVTGYSPAIWTNLSSGGALIRNTTFYMQGTSSAQVGLSGVASYISSGVNMSQSDISCGVYMMFTNKSISIYQGFYDGILGNTGMGVKSATSSSFYTLSNNAGGNTVSSSALSPFVWKRFIVSKTSSNMSLLYIDNVSVASFTDEPSNMQRVWLGQLSGSTSNSSLLFDDFKCWSGGLVNEPNYVSNGNFSIISLYDQIFSSPIMNFSAVINGTLFYSNVSSGVLVSTIPNNFSQNVSVVLYAQNYSSRSLSVNVSGNLNTYLYPIFDARAIVNVSNGSMTISSFVLNVTDLTLGSTDSYAVSSSPFTVFITQNHSYSFLVDNSSFALANYSLTNVSVIMNYINISLLPKASFIIRIFEESSLALIKSNVTVTLTDITHPVIYVKTTNTGYVNFTDLTLDGDLYELKFVGSSYNVARYYETLLDRSAKNIDAYLINGSIAQNFSISFYNTNGAAVYNLNVKQYSLTNVSYVLVSEVLTNPEGTVFLSFNPSNYYLISYESLDGYYLPSSFILNPPLANHNYVVSNLTRFSSPVSILSYNIWSNSSYDGDSLISFSYVQNSYYGLINYSVSTAINGNWFTICGGGSVNSSASFLCNVSGYDGTVLVNGWFNNTAVYGQYYSLQRVSLADYLTHSDQVLYAGLIMLICIFAGAVFGIWSSLILGVVSLIIINSLGLLSLDISVAVVAVSSIIGLVIGFKAKR